MEKISGRPIELLLVEDSEPDVRLTKEALHEAKVRNRLWVVEDGVEAMEFLQRRGQYADAPRPDLILLDLNLPRKDGRAVLKEIKSDELLEAHSRGDPYDVEERRGRAACLRSARQLLHYQARGFQSVHGSGKIH